MLRRTIAALSVITVAACNSQSEEKSDNSSQSSTQAVTTNTVSTTQSTGTVEVPRAVTPVTFEEGETAFRDRKYVEATRLFEGYVEQKPGNAWGYYMLGLSAWKAGDLEKAKASLEKSLELDPRHVKSMLNLGRVLVDLDKPAEARKHVSVAIALDSSSSEAHRLMGRIYSSLKQHEEAIVSYRVALSHDPTDVWSMNNMSLIMIQQKRFEEALPALARAVQLDSTNAVIQNNLGITLEHLGQYSLATKAYRAAVAADVNYTKAVTSLVRVEGRKEDPSVVVADLPLLAQKFDTEVRTVPVSVTVAKKIPPQW